MTKRLILHIGANKTGTSSIQRMLSENRGVLNENGWDYPEFHMLHMAHHPLAYSISGHPSLGLPGDWEAEFRDLLATSKHRLIFSSELFFRTVDPRQVARFFPPDQTQVVLYLREHLAYMMSWYAQAVQERNLTASFTDYIHLFPQKFSSYLAQWEAVYGAQNVVTRVFERKALKDQDSRADFLQYIDGVDLDSMGPQSDDSNLSISGNLLFFKQILNHYMTFEESTMAPVTDEVGAFAAVKDSFNGKFHVSPGEVNTVRAIFREDVEALSQRGIQFSNMVQKVEGWPAPDFNILRADFKLIKDIAVNTDKKFLMFTERWPDWTSL